MYPSLCTHTMGHGHGEAWTCLAPQYRFMHRSLATKEMGALWVRDASSVDAPHPYTCASQGVIIALAGHVTIHTPLVGRPCHISRPYDCIVYCRGNNYNTCMYMYRKKKKRSRAKDVLLQSNRFDPFSSSFGTGRRVGIKGRQGVSVSSTVQPGNLPERGDCH